MRMPIAAIGQPTMSLVSKLWWYILHVKLLETFAVRHQCIHLFLAMGTKLFSAKSTGCDLWLIKMLLGQQHIKAKGRWVCSLWPKAKQSALKMTLVLRYSIWLRTVVSIKDIITNTIQHKYLFLRWGNRVFMLKCSVITVQINVYIYFKE